MKKYLFFFFFLLFITLFYTNPFLISAQQGTEVKEGPEVYAVQGTRYIDIYVKNKEAYDTTVNITCTTLENMASTEFLPCVTTVYGGETRKAFSLYRVNSKQTWKYYYQYNWTGGSKDAEHDDKYIYSLPYTSGSTYKIIQGYNGKFSHFGDDIYALDWDMPEGTPVCAARDGIVVYVKNIYSEGKPDVSYKNYCNCVWIRHKDHTVGNYAHFMKDGVKVLVGQKVKAGDFLGLSGNTGYSSGPHLHFHVFKGVDGYRLQTIPIKFKTSSEKSTVLIEGNSYTAP